MSLETLTGGVVEARAGQAPARTPADASVLMDRVEAIMRGLVATTHPGAAQQAALAHINSGGGRFRARLAIEAGLALGLAPSDFMAIAASVELVHNASLVHDDLQDRDPRRRGAPAVWIEHGESVAICAGDLLLSAAYAAMASTPGAARFIPRLHHSVGELIAGQGADLAGGHTVDDLKHYESIAGGKSGPLLSLPLWASLELAGAEELIPVAQECGRRFALGYQMFDDLRDLEPDRSKGGLNAVLVVEAAGVSKPENEITLRAIRHFQTSAALAQTLPADCARLIAEAANNLSAALTQEEIS